MTMQSRTQCASGAGTGGKGHSRSGAARPVLRAGIGTNCRARGRVLVTEGNLVSGGGAGAATLLTTIVSIDPVHVYFDIDEATYVNVVSRSRPVRDSCFVARSSRLEH